MRGGTRVVLSASGEADNGLASAVKFATESEDRVPHWLRGVSAVSSISPSPPQLTSRCFLGPFGFSLPSSCLFALDASLHLLGPVVRLV